MSLRTDRIITVTPRGSSLSIPMKVDDRVLVKHRSQDGYSGFFRNLGIIVSLEVKSDGKVWIHASVSLNSGKMPEYEHLLLLKDIAFGPLRKAVQVFPPKHEHISAPPAELVKQIGGIHKEVLHLWGPHEQVGEDVHDWLPNMTEEGQL